MTYIIKINDYGGISWTINSKEFTFEMLKKFIKEINNSKYKFIIDKALTKKDLNSLNLLLNSRSEYLFNIIYKWFINQDILLLLLLARNDCNSLFSKTYFPLDIFKIIYKNIKQSLILKLKANSFERCIIYLICKLFDLKTKILTETVKVLIPCTIFLPCNKDISYDLHKTHMFYNNDYVCGCEFAPQWFSKNHHNNNYEDTISYSYEYRTKKIGLEIFK